MPSAEIFPDDLYRIFTADLERDEHFWSDDKFAAEVRRKGQYVTSRLSQIAATAPARLSVKGRGLMQGLSFADPEQASAVSREAFRRGMIIETGGPNDEVLKCLCPLTISDADLERGLTVLEQSVAAVLSSRQSLPRAAV